MFSFEGVVLRCEDVILFSEEFVLCGWSGARYCLGVWFFGWSDGPSFGEDGVFVGGVLVCGMGGWGGVTLARRSELGWLYLEGLLGYSEVVEGGGLLGGLGICIGGGVSFEVLFEFFECVVESGTGGHILERSIDDEGSDICFASGGHDGVVYFLGELREGEGDRCKGVDELEVFFEFINFEVPGEDFIVLGCDFDGFFDEALCTGTHFGEFTSFTGCEGDEEWEFFVDGFDSVEDFFFDGFIDIRADFVW